MNKKVLAIVFIVVLLLGIVVTAIISKNMSSNEKEATSVSQEAEETTVPPELRMEYPDRLYGNLKSNYKAEGSTVVITYGSSGTITRVFASDELLSSKEKYPEESNEELGGQEVTLKGVNGKVYTAAWIDNNNSYLIELNPDGRGIDAEEMEVYIEATE